MNKKIIAFGLVLVFIATMFTACKPKYELTKINGEEYVLATDENGSTIINDDNKIAINPTDYDGKLQKDENGELVTYWVQLYGDIKGEDFIKGDNYKMMAIEGWTPGQLGRIFKDDTDEKCYVQFAKVVEYSEDMDLETYLEGIDTQNKQYISAFEQKGYKCTIDKKAAGVSTVNKSLNCTRYVYEIRDNADALIHYAENFYFVSDSVIYKLGYVCTDGVGYDENFSFGDYISKNFQLLES